MGNDDQPETTGKGRITVQQFNHSVVSHRIFGTRGTSGGYSSTEWPLRTGKEMTEISPEDCRRAVVLSATACTDHRKFRGITGASTQKDQGGYRRNFRWLIVRTLSVRNIL